MLVRRVAAPQTLDELGGRHAAAVQVLLPLLLLHLQGETRTQDALRQEGPIQYPQIATTSSIQTVPTDFNNGVHTAPPPQLMVTQNHLPILIQ